MISAEDCAKRYGKAERETAMRVFTLPDYLKIPHIPSRIYCNRELIRALTRALENVKARGLQDLIVTWDGCFNIRPSKGNRKSLSLHAWGLAVDINAAWNGYGKTPQQEPELVKAFKDAGFAWGGDWRKPDGMHFELREFPDTSPL